MQYQRTMNFLAYRLFVLGIRWASKENKRGKEIKNAVYCIHCRKWNRVSDKRYWYKDRIKNFRIGNNNNRFQFQYDDQNEFSLIQNLSCIKQKVQWSTSCACCCYHYCCWWWWRTNLMGFIQHSASSNVNRNSLAVRQRVCRPFAPLHSLIPWMLL